LSATAYPLTWPDTMPRTERPVSSQFRTQLPAALSNVRKSLASFAADSGKKIESLIISSNVTLGDDKPLDPGVAVWFVWDQMQVCIAVDRYPKVQDNLQAIHHIIEARRTEMRHGGLHIVRATFRGFQALPSPDAARKRHWREVLQFNPGPVTKAQVETAYRIAAREAHPDAGGSSEAFHELQQARDEALREISQ